MNMKISFGRDAAPEGATGVAVGLLANALNKAIGKHQRENTWSQCLSLVVASHAGVDSIDGRVKATEGVFNAIATAIGATITAQHLVNAGYGALTSVVEDEDGKESLPGKARSEWIKRYGENFKLRAAIKDANKLADQYKANILAAVRAGAILTVGMTGRELAKAGKDAAEASMTEDQRAAAEETAATERQSRECGISFASAFKSGNGDLRAFLGAVQIIAEAWDRVPEGDVNDLLGMVGMVAEAVREEAYATGDGGTETGEGESLAAGLPEEAGELTATRERNAA